MMYLLAILLPPVAVLICGKPIQFLINCLLTLCFWIPGSLHALLVVSSTQADRCTARIVKSNQQVARAIERQGGDQRR